MAVSSFRIFAAHAAPTAWVIRGPTTEEMDTNRPSRQVKWQGIWCPFERAAGVPLDRADERLQGEAAEERGSDLAVLRKDPVLRLHRERAGDDGRLLPHRRAVEADAPLALQGQHALVEDALEEHEPVERLQLIPPPVRR